MRESQGLDWYQISKLNQQQFSLQKFHSIVNNAEVTYGVDRVTAQYRKKLLILFQNASRIMKNEGADLVAENSELEMKRNIVADKLAGMQQEVESSFKQISNMKFIVEEKKRLLGKLRERVTKKNKNNAKKYYCCTLCDKQNFSSVETLKQHVDTEHQFAKTGENRSLISSQVNDLKDLILTMKDKQIEMMSMFLRASRQMQTQKLQDDYKNEYRKYMQVSAAKTEESKEEADVEQLKGSSQFVFFQKSQPFRREMERDQQFRTKLAKNKQKYTLEKEFFQADNYYNVFGNVEENVSSNIEQQPSNSEESMEREQSRQQRYYDPNELISKFIRNQNISKESKLNLVENGTPKPIVQLKDTKLVEKQSQLASPSISDRLRQINKQKKDCKNQSMFSTKRKFYEDTDFVFNSGPLLDDRGGDSDYEDYFGKNLVYSQSVDDEEIKLHPVKGSGYVLANSSKQSINFSKLLSPNSFLDKSQKSKDSVIVDLSDSFSKRDVEVSKDEIINLSDLKLSKLERRKEEERAQNKLKATEKKQINNSINTNVGSGLIRIVEDKIEERNQYDFLKEFERQKIAPLKQQNYRFEELSYPTNGFIKTTNNRISTIESNPKSNARVGVLNEFLRKEVEITAYNSKLNAEQALLDQFTAH